MRKISGSLVVICFVSTLLVGQNANAVIASTCQGPHNGNASCTFYLAGSYIGIDGWSSASFAPTRVAVLTPAGTEIFSCSGNGSCSAHTTSAVTDPFIDLPAGVPLTCRITAGGPGSYRCMSVL